jgi:hypothetical protein
MAMLLVRKVTKKIERSTMTTNDQKHAEQAARSALDQNMQELPEDIASALAAARKMAIQSAEQSEDSNQPTAALFNLRSYQFDRPKMIWSGAIAASVTALALTLALQQPGADFPVEADYLLTLTELESLDDTEWALVQDLEFALWLSEVDLGELGEDTLAIEPQS